MIIIGCDFPTRFQQIAMLDPATGEVIERRLEHENGEAEKFYGTLPGPARVGIEATINAQWFERTVRRYLTYTLQHGVEPQEIIYAPIDENAFNERIRNPADTQAK